MKNERKNVYIFYVAALTVSHKIENKLASLITVYFCFISLLMGYKEDLSTLWSQQRAVESLTFLSIFTLNLNCLGSKPS